MSPRVLAALLVPLAAASPARAGDGGEAPAFPREFRAAWVATVANIDWPSRPGFPAADQKREALAILDRCAGLGLNAVVFQVRPAADALYDSEREPWSYYLTGTQGRGPEPAYDPLTYWVEEAHRRGLLLHAWFNPFRARPDGARYEAAAGHVSRTRPDLTKRYGGLLWLDPGEPDARDLTLGAILDVVRRYDVDGVHLDDYFYPYPATDPATGRELEFPDEPSWQTYRKSGGALARDDWRRRNINDLIRRIHEEVHRAKPGVLFGISPFGIIRPGHPPGVKGFDQFARLYADAALWFHEGWCDYISPQLYWKVDAPGQPFRPLLKAWVGENARSRHLWPGLSVSRVGPGRSQYAPEEILNQIAILRETPGASGHILFSMKALMQDRREIATRLKDGPYQSPSLVPLSPWIKGTGPAPPAVSLDRGDGRARLSVRPAGGDDRPPFLWAVRERRGRDWSFASYPAGERSLPVDGSATSLDVTAVDRLGRTSLPVPVPLDGPPRD